MWKGYIPTGGKDGKVPTEEYKGRTKFYKLDDVEALQSFGGVLENDIIQIDVDDTKQAETLLSIITELNVRCSTIKTSRGMHFYFKNTGIDKRKQGYFTPIGIKIDVGLGSQNAVVPLKIKGTMRKTNIIDDIDHLPAWLIPLQKKDLNFKRMGEGDGRNSTLFTYILTLQGVGLNKDEIKETIKIINKFILEQPLEQKEIDTILRDEAFLKQTFYIKDKLQYEKLATYLKENENIIKINNTLHIYENGAYTDDLDAIERVQLKYIKNSTRTPRQEVIRYLELLCENKKMTSPKFICLENGVMDLETKELQPHDPKFIIKNKIPVSYNPDAYVKAADHMLDRISCNNKDLRSVMEEMMGYCLLRRNEIGKAFILTGGGSNGKSTLLDVLEALLGENNISSVELKELNNRFKTYQLEGKLANIGDDISKQFIEDNSTFKKLVTGEKVNVERKGKDPYDIQNYSKLIFSANDLPRIDDTSDGLKRRVIFIPFNAKFSKSDADFDPWIKDKILTDVSLEYFLNLALAGLKRVLYNKAFTHCDKCVELWEEYDAINNPVVGFLEEFDIENETVKETYLSYSNWCAENGLKTLSKPIFGREIKKRGWNSNSRITIRGKQQRIYRRN